MTSAYRSNIFDLSGSTFQAFTDLTGEAVEIKIDTKQMRTGEIVVDVDGSTMLSTTVSEVRTRMFEAFSSVTIKSKEDYEYRTTGLTSEVGAPTGVAFKGDGTRMYVSDDNSDAIYQYTVDAAWDLGLLTYNDVSLDVASEDSIPRGLTFKDDGTKLFLCGKSNDQIHSYELSSAWDLSSASFLDSNGTSENTDHSDVSFNDDGSKMFVTDLASRRIYWYDLSTKWGVRSASYNTSRGLLEPSSVLTGHSFADGGTKLYVTENSGTSVYVYDLSTAYDISTPTFDREIDVSSNTGNTRNVFVRDDMEYLIIPDDSYVHQYRNIFDGKAFASVRKERP